MLNLLQNPGFEEPYTQREAPEIKVAASWHFGYDSSVGPRPELGPEVAGVAASRVMDGARAQKGFFTFNRGHWWVWQQVPVVAGHWYRGLVYVWCWSSERDDASVSSGATGKLWCRVGINPWGVVEPISWGTVYGQALVAVYDKWQIYEVIAQANREQIAFIVDLKNEERAKHNDWYIESAFLHEIPAPSEWDGGQPEPEPEPGTGASLEDIRRVIREELGGLSVDLRVRV